MARYAIIENGIVTNVIESDATFAAQVGAVLAESASPGDRYQNGEFLPPAPAMPSSLEEYDTALTQHLDSVAQSRRYSDRISCSVRAGYVGPFQAEGIAFATWMDASNAIGYQMLADFQAGLIPQPTIQEVLDALPDMVWPT